MRGLYTGAEKFHAQTSRGDGGGKQKFIVKELYAVVASWQRFGPSNLVWLMLVIKQIHWNIQKKKLYFLPI